MRAAQEAVLEVEYFLAVVPPDAQQALPHDDWCAESRSPSIVSVAPWNQHAAQQARPTPAAAPRAGSLLTKSKPLVVDVSNTL